MNARQKAKTDMFKAIEQVCDDNSNILGEIVAFRNAFNQFKTLLAGLLETEQLRSLPLTGIAADKSADRARLCELLTTIAGFIYAYAASNKNETLKAEVNYTRSKFLQMREDQLVSVSQNIHALGTDNKDALRDFGVADANLSNLQTAINAFKDSLPKPRLAKGQKVTMTAAAEETLAQLDEILTNQMDFLIEGFKSSNSNFVNLYREARKIKDPATTTTQLKGTVTNKADNTPIKDATITVVELNISTKTNSSGEYSFKPIEIGEFTIKVTANGFQDYEINEFKVKLGEVNKLNLHLHK